MAPPVPPKGEVPGSGKRLIPGSRQRVDRNWSPDAPKAVHPPPYKGVRGPKTPAWAKPLGGVGVATAGTSVASGSQQGVSAGPSKASKAGKTAKNAPQLPPAAPLPAATFPPQQYPGPAASQPPAPPPPKVQPKADPKSKQPDKATKNPVSAPAAAPTPPEPKSSADDKTNAGADQDADKGGPFEVFMSRRRRRHH